MAVHFNFVVDDQDAENIFYTIRDAALANDVSIMDYQVKSDITDQQRECYISWHRANKAYMLELMGKMFNSSVSQLDIIL